jgi:release factor glutamine methyltransferase
MGAAIVMGATTDRSARPERQSVRQLLAELAVRLAAATAIDRPEAEARELLAYLLDQPKHWPSLNTDLVVEPATRARALAAAAKRAKGAPMAYCVGTAAFRHLTLEVDERVLIPRAETEQLIDVAVSELGLIGGGVAVDVGTGSGAIALALATEQPFDHVIATDVSADALAVARQNAARLEGRLLATVEFRQGSLLGPVNDVRPILIVSNPPYIANDEAEALPASVRDWEPPVALLSGRDGLHATARLVREAAERLAPDGALALEVDSRRAEAVAAMARRDARFRGVRVLRDLAGRDRFVVARRKEEG